MLALRSVRQVAIASIGLLVLVTGCSNEPAGLTPMQRAKLNFQDGNWETALLAVDGVIASEPNNADAYVLRGRVRHILRDPQKALADFDRAIELSPKLSEAHYQRAAALRDLGEQDKADTAEQLAREYDPLREETMAMAAQLPPDKPVKGPYASTSEPEERTEKSEQPKPALIPTLAEREEKERAERDPEPARSALGDAGSRLGHSDAKSGSFSRSVGDDRDNTSSARSGRDAGNNSFRFTAGDESYDGNSEEPTFLPRSGAPRLDNLGQSYNQNQDTPDTTPTVRPSLPPIAQWPFTTPGLRSTGVQPYSPLLPNVLGQQNLGGAGLPGLGGGALTNSAPATGLNSRQTGAFVPGVSTGLVQDLSRQVYQSRQAQRQEAAGLTTSRKTSLNAGMVAPLPNPYAAGALGSNASRRTLQQAPATGNDFQNVAPIGPPNGGVGPTIPPAGGGFRTFP